MKKLFILCLTCAAAYSSQRVVVAEQFTGTWCTYCPGAARGLFEMYERTYDSLVVIAYHLSDAFTIPEANERSSFYGVTGIPAVWFDGIISEVGGLHYGTMYPPYQRHITARLGESSPLEITLVGTYNVVTDSGTVTATISNTSASTVSGDLHFVIVENYIPYNWQGMTELEFVARDMLPDAQGEAVTILALDTIIRSRDYVTDPSWDELNCKIVVFIQSSGGEIYQGAEIALIEEPRMEYYGSTIIETSGNGNGVIEPDESMEMRVSGKNLGAGFYTGGAGIQFSDPYITITGITPQTISIGPGDIDTVINLTFDIGANCPNPHLTEFKLIFNATDTATIPLMITTRPGFTNDVESGEGDWTHYGTRDNWHITEHKSNSPTHSWYSGVEGSWQYTNENDASLVSPYFVVPPGSTLYFYHQYSLEPGYDYSYIDVDNGSGWWKTLDEFNGDQSSWTQVSYPLNDYDGQTIRVRFRFVSDYNTTAEGWYIDDISVPTDIGVEEHIPHSKTQIPLLQVHPNPFSKLINISFGIGHPDRITHSSYGTGSAESIELKIFDATGRLIKQFNHLTIQSFNQIVWDGTNDRGTSVPEGVYFMRLETGDIKSNKKIIRLR